MFSTVIKVYLVTLLSSIGFLYINRKALRNNKILLFLSLLVFMIYNAHSSYIAYYYFNYRFYKWYDVKTAFGLISFKIFILMTLCMYLGGLVLFAYFIFKLAKNYWEKRKSKVQQMSAIHTNEQLSRREFFEKIAWKVPELAIQTYPITSISASIAGMILGSTDIEVEKISVKINHLHEDLKGLRIGQISDLHIGTIINDSYLNVCKEKLLSLNLDMIVVTGDTLDNSTRYLPTLERFFGELKSKFNREIYVITGNHDFFDSINKFKNSFHKLDIPILSNESVLYKKGNGMFNLIGLDFPWPYRGISKERIQLNRTYFDQAMKTVHLDYPKILLNHDPSDFQWLQKKSIDLILSGHTHGGQINFIDKRDSFLSPMSALFEYYRGFYVENNVQLYINRGTGHSLPIRINTPPEITVVELV